MPELTLTLTIYIIEFGKRELRRQALAFLSLIKVKVIIVNQKNSFLLLAYFIILLNFFVFIKFKKYKQEYKTFYVCYKDSQSKVYNYPEFKTFKLKFEKLYNMSPHCEKLE